MNPVSESIAALRREKGLTQDELGKAAGVSMQAVSKWENGGMPDPALLPDIARALGTSIDKLFGLNPTPGDAERAVVQMIADTPNPNRFSRAFDLIWALQLSLFGVNADNGLPQPRGGGHSQIMSGEGVSLVGLDPDANYAFFAPAPEGGYSALVKPEIQIPLFALLGQPDAFRLLVFLHSRGGSPFTAEFAARQVGTDKVRVEELLERFLEYRLADTDMLDIDNEKRRVYTCRPNPAVLPLLLFALEIAEPPQFFYYQSGTAYQILSPRSGEKEFGETVQTP